jgi:octaprenyl-diphosphate synthase
VQCDVSTSLGDAVSADGGDALVSLSMCLRDDLEACNRTIRARMDSTIELIPRLAAHVVAAGGKRLRPVLTLAAARLCNYPEAGDVERPVRLAACVELIHTATLLHDDVVDASLLRRGRASANALFGNKPPVLVGDFLFARAFQIMVEDGSPRVLAILSNAAATMAAGEVLQLTTQNDLETTDAIYLDVVKGKTAALFGAACQVGAIAAGRPDAEPALAAYGTNLGIAFQLVDDALDYAADERVLGKTVGDDFREGKVTLPVLMAYRRGGDAERAFWQRTIGRVEQQNGDLDRAITLIRKHDAIGGTLSRAGVFAIQARHALAGFPDTPLRRRLRGVADYSVNRSR